MFEVDRLARSPDGSLALGLRMVGGSVQGDARSPDGSLAMAAPGGLPWGLLGGCAGAKIGKETQGAKGQRGKSAKATLGFKNV
jgi:hypothetical protein